MDSPVNAFVQAAEARSFTVAGWQFGVSSSAIGKAVARMEERPKLRVSRGFPGGVSVRHASPSSAPRDKAR